MNRTKSSTAGRLAAGFLAPTVILLAPFITWIVFYDYPLLAGEILLCIGVFVLVGGATFLVLRIRPDISKPLIYPVLFLLALDMHFAMRGSIKLTHDLFQSENTSAVALTISLSIFYILSSVICRILNQHIDLIITTIFGFFIASTLIFGSKVDLQRYDHGPLGQNRKDDLPPVIHLILDEQMGFAGFPEHIPDRTEVTAEITELYSEFGFRIFDNAFSSHTASIISISALLNAHSGREWRDLLEEDNKKHYTKINQWFDLLAQAGYAIHVYQSSYLDFCRHGNASIRSCEVYPPDSILALRDTKLTTTRRAIVLMVSFFGRSLSYQVAYRVAAKTSKTDPSANGAVPRFRIGGKPSFGAISSLGAFEDLKRDVISQPRGNAFFAHLLIPHRTYLLDEDCKVSWPLNKWHLGFESADRRFNNAESRTDAYVAYSNQVRCVHRQIKDLLDELLESNDLADAVVIVHGDHGSRISINSPVDTDDLSAVSPQDLIDTFSTFFAVKAPGMSPGKDRRLWSVTDIFAEFLLNQPVEHPDDKVYWVDDKDALSDPRIRLPMPRVSP